MASVLNRLFVPCPALIRFVLVSVWMYIGVFAILKSSLLYSKTSWRLWGGCSVFDIEFRILTFTWFIFMKYLGFTKIVLAYLILWHFIQTVRFAGPTVVWSNCSLCDYNMWYTLYFTTWLYMSHRLNALYKLENWGLWQPSQLRKFASTDPYYRYKWFVCIVLSCCVVTVCVKSCWSALEWICRIAYFFTH